MEFQFAQFIQVVFNRMQQFFGQIHRIFFLCSLADQDGQQLGICEAVRGFY